MLRMFFAGTSIRPREWTYLQDAVPLYSDTKNILIREDANNKSYYFPGPLAKLSLDQGKYSIQNNFERSVKILKKDIDKLLEEDSNQEINIEIAGHSRGGVAAGRVVKKIQEDYKNNSNVHIKLISLDPVPGPGHYGDDVNLELDENTADNNALIYSLTTPALHSPQVLKNVNTVIIKNTHHNGVFGNESYGNNIDTIDKYYFDYNYQRYSLSELYKLKGLYFCEKYSNNLIKINKNEDFSEYINTIYEICDDSNRIKTIMNSITDTLDLKLDDMLKNNIKYKAEFDLMLDQIKGSWFITSSYNKALELFQNKSDFSSLINKEENLYEYILNSSKNISGFSNEPQKAYNYLKQAQQNLNLGENANNLIETLKSKLKSRYDVC